MKGINNIMTTWKKLSLVGALLLGLTLNSGAATVAFTVNGWTNKWAGFGCWTNLIDGGVKVNAISITTIAGAATNVNYAFLDAPLSNSLARANFWKAGLSNPAYMSVSSFSSNVSVMKTNPWIHALNVLGVVTNFTGATNVETINNVVFTVTNAVAAGLTAWDTRLAGVAVSNGVATSVTIPAGGIYFFRGVTVTNSSVPVVYTVNIDYDQF